MTKNDLQTLVNELREGACYLNVDTAPLHGCGLPDFEKGKMIRKEVLVQFLRWQCLMMNGNIDEEELCECLAIFKEKKIMML